MLAKTSAWTRLLEAAARLFYAHGIAATGIDAIIAEAGVAPALLVLVREARVPEPESEPQLRRWPDDDAIGRARE